MILPGSMPLSAGTRLGPYEVLAALGAGGMGEVYKARDTRLDRTVAVKVLPGAPSRPRGAPAVRARGETISQLSHPHICALYDIGREGETEYLVMEYLEGETLGGASREGRVAARADAALRRRDRRRAGQGAPAGDRPSGPEARQRDADEVGSEASRFRAGEGDGAGGRRRQPRPRCRRRQRSLTAGGNDPRHVPVHGAGAARGEGGRRADGHLRAGRDALRDGDGEEGLFGNEPGLA